MRAPVRLSCDDMSSIPDGMMVRLWLDGVEVGGWAVAYDIEGQAITHPKRGPDGEFLIDRAKGEFVMETVHGHVEAELADVA